MLTDTQRDELATTGITYLRGVLSRSEASAIENRVWEFYADKLGVVRDDRSTWPVRGFETHLQRLNKTGTFHPFDTPFIDEVLNDLLGDWRYHHAWGNPLITFPSPGPWEMPKKIWHFDHRASGPVDGMFLMRMFGFVNDVVPQGGGTLVIEGSHELVRRMVEVAPNNDAGTSAKVKKRLAEQHEWFRAPSFEPTEIDGVRVCARELTGQAGDVALMLPWTMHNISPNCGDQPRFMVTHTAFRV